MKKMLCFDMDGTIANLYGQPNWLECLLAENISPYINADPLVDMAELRKVLLDAKSKGWEVRVISWLAKDSSEKYKAAVRQAKLNWLDRYNFPTDAVHMVAYGTTKANCVRRYFQRGDQFILLDDNKEVRQGWHLGDTIDAEKEDIIERLKAIIEERA